ncbi:hypothetical protein [Lysinibacillus boronitolerans]|uniref:hypothetical protein n=1 Tax=Lysinibacillus boronitolerans TaxID=309788 RepID=UPI0038550A12
MILSNGASLLARVIAMASYGPKAKAYKLNTIAKAESPTFNGLYQSYITFGIFSGLKPFKILQDVYQKGGKKALAKYLRK